MRRFGQEPVTATSMIENKTMMAPMLELLSATVQGRLNILISGGTALERRHCPTSDRLYSEH
jgi:Flp pilus assembly CpaF family ATPase